MSKFLCFRLTHLGRSVYRIEQKRHLNSTPFFTLRRRKIYPRNVVIFNVLRFLRLKKQTTDKI
jgi:hypothetical protein